MAVCTFFGHRDTPDEVAPVLKSTLIDLIENQGVDIFYVGNHGKFDFMVYKALKEFKEIYPYIKYSVVLAYIPKHKSECDTIDYVDTVYPEGLENVPPKYAIIERNKWMLSRADTVVAYVTHTLGGAGEIKLLAERKGKRVINLAKKA